MTGWVRIFNNNYFSHVSFLPGNDFFMVMLIYSSFMHDDKNNHKGDSKKLGFKYSSGVGIAGWIFFMVIM